MNDEHPVLVEACIDVELRERAESILTQLGMSASAAITYYYQQIVLHNVLGANGLTALNMRLYKGIEDQPLPLAEFLFFCFQSLSSSPRDR